MSLVADIKDHIIELKKTEAIDLALKLEKTVHDALDYQLNLKLDKLLFTERVTDDGDTCWALHLDIGSITVLNRMTGFSFGRDTETGFRDPYGKFWLVSGNYDIRSFDGDITVREAISMIKDNSNTCRGK